MEGSNGHRKLSGREKLEIVFEGMINENGVGEVCRRRGINTTQYYQWRDRLYKMAEEIYRRKGKEKTKREEWLEQRNRRLEAVIAEITAENLALKKTPGV